MLQTILKIEWLNLKRDRIALMIVFVLPIIFFSIFAMIFGGMSGGGSGSNSTGLSSAMRVIVVDEDQTELSRRFVEAMKDEPGLDVIMTIDSDDDTTTQKLHTRETALPIVRKDEDVAAAIILREGFDATFASFGDGGGEVGLAGVGEGGDGGVEVVYDPANMVAEFAIPGTLQGVAMQAAPDILAERGFAMMDEFGPGVTDEQRAFLDQLRSMLEADATHNDTETDNTAGQIGGLVSITTTNVRDLPTPDQPESDTPQATTMLPYYAAGIGVMFLLFSMVSAAGSIIKEEETGSLERLLISNMSVTQLLAGKWLFYTLVGCVQVIAMFIWGELVLGDLQLFTVHHFVGMLIMTVVTAGAASAFGMMMGSICRTRGQLDGIATIVILMMSAVGGSMVPRMFMPPFMKSLGKYTFNGQALDGYLAVFWDGYTTDSILTLLQSMLLPILILTAMGLVFFTIARIMARRWETI